MTATRIPPTRIIPDVVPKHLRAPQAAPTRTRVTANAAGRTSGVAAPGPRRKAPTTRTDAAAARAAAAQAAADPRRTASIAASDPRRTAAPRRTASTARATATTATATATPRPADSCRPASNSRKAAGDRSADTRWTASNARSSAARTSATRSAAARSAAARSSDTSSTGAAATARPLPLPLTAPQPRTQPVRRTPLRIVAPPDPEAKARTRRRLWAGALAGLACAGLFAIVGVRVLLAQGQGPVDQLESKVTAAQAENQRLRLDVARLESPSRIVGEAQARLGMVPPAVVVYLPPLESPHQTTTPAG